MRSNGIELFKFSIEKVLKKYGKWFLKCVGSLVIIYLKQTDINWENSRERFGLTQNTLKNTART